MTEPELEELLRRYRPVGPPLDLRARVLSADTRRAWPWAAAAAALLAATVYFHTSANHIVASANVPASPDATDQAISLMTEMLGGDASARQMAELTIAIDEMRAERDRGVANSMGAGEPQ